MDFGRLAYRVPVPVLGRVDAPRCAELDVGSYGYRFLFSRSSKSKGTAQTKIAIDLILRSRNVTVERRSSVRAHMHAHRSHTAAHAGTGLRSAAA